MPMEKDTQVDLGRVTLETELFSILLTHEGSHREVYRDFQPSLTSSAGPVPRVDQTTGSVHPQPILPNCQLCINTEPTTSK